MDVENNVVDTLFENWQEFNIIDLSCATTITETIGDAVFINMKKSSNGAFLRHLRGTHQTTEISQTARSGELSKEKIGIMQRLWGK